MNAARPTRPTPLKMFDQPIQRKFCCPCIMPQNRGSQSESNMTGRVSHKPAGLVICQRAKMSACQIQAPATTTSHKPNVPSQASRIMPASSRSRFVASALAVCCANTICNGIFGTHITTASNTPNTPYSSAGIFLASRWTAHISMPPTMLATINQPLCRKKCPCCEIAVAELACVFSAVKDMAGKIAGCVWPRKGNLQLKNFNHG